MNRRLQSFAALCCFSVFLCTGCAPTASRTGAGQATTPQSIAAVPPRFEDVLALTAEHEHAIDDGWWFSEYPRIFKTGYAGATPQLKAQFACDYAGMLADARQDLVADWNSYVTYTKRAEFANSWWQKHDDSGLFANLSPKMHVLWIHEALLDGSELWWRAFEQKNARNLQAATALAHDEEQKKVFNYMDQEGRPRSLSDLVATSAHRQQN